MVLPGTLVLSIIYTIPISKFPIHQLLHLGFGAIDQGSRPQKPKDPLAIDQKHSPEKARGFGAIDQGSRPQKPKDPLAIDQKHSPEKARGFGAIDRSGIPSLKVKGLFGHRSEVQP